MNDTLTTLQVARDAQLMGRDDLAQILFDQVAPDFAYVRRSARRVHPRFYADYVDDEDEDPRPIVEQQRAYAQRCKRIDWTGWQSTFRGFYGVERSATRGLAAWLPAAGQGIEFGVDRAVQTPQTLVVSPAVYEDLRRRLSRDTVRLGGVDVPVVVDQNCPRGRTYLVNAPANKANWAQRLSTMLNRALGEDK